MSMSDEFAAEGPAAEESAAEGLATEELAVEESAAEDSVAYESVFDTVEPQKSVRPPKLKNKYYEAELAGSRRNWSSSRATSRRRASRSW